MNKSIETETRKKVFVSYSWTPERNKKWVKELVQKLENDGIQVVIDFKDLKLGHDKFAFMEKMVNDVSIDKVLIICNKSYKEKADNRSGGVGDESVIITPQLYGDVRQEKFIPVVNEYDEEGKPCLPNYLSSRMYADLTEFGKGYEELLDNILGDSRRKFSEEQSEPLVIKDIDAYDLPTAFFDYRFGKAFPGIRGMQEFDVPGECIDRLEILLRNPLRAKKRNMVDPIWWLRGSSNNEIDIFKRLGENSFLMNEKQFEIKKLIAYASPNYYKKFVYIETNPEKPTGLYGSVTKEQMQYWVNEIGAYFEEYALFNEHLITRAEYDDGAAIINGKIVDIERKAEVRVRYLTPYNFIICAKWNPLNQTNLDDRVEGILCGILNGTHTINDMIHLCEKLPKHKMDTYF